jgi:hypothetical protein
MTAWVEVPAEVGRPARVRVGDGRREAAGLTLEGLLGAVDEAEEFVRAQAGRAGGPRRGPRHPGFCSPAFLEGAFSELRIQPPAWTPSQFAQEHILLSGDRATDNNICRTRIAMHALHHVSISISWDTNINGADLNDGCAPSYRQQERIASWAALAGHGSAR